MLKVEHTLRRNTGVQKYTEFVRPPVLSVLMLKVRGSYQVLNVFSMLIFILTNLICAGLENC